MYFKTYDYVGGSVINTPATEFDFGDVIQGQHGARPVLIRGFLDMESTVSDFLVFLESKGGWSGAAFGYYTDSTFIPSIESGSSLISNHFVETPDASATSPNGIAIDWTDSTSNYLWLDVDISSSQTGTTDANYRFIYNYT